MKKYIQCIICFLCSGPLLLSAAVPDDTTRTPPVEGDYYKLVTLPIPEGIVLEVGGMEVLPDGRLAVATRRGEVWIVENPDMTGGARPHFRRFAHGLHEALGLAYRDGAIYTTQRGELTRLYDRDGDGRADRYESVYRWPLNGNYHEYSYGPTFAPNGNMIVTLNLAWVGYGASLSKWRGWALEITPDGEMTPMASGMRSPAGFGFDPEGELFYAENQGDWIGSGYITHVEKGDFVGNPAGLRWTDEPDSPLRLKPEDIPSTGKPLFEVARDIPELKPPAVWFPHTLMGISTSDILADSTQGGFGPFDGQLFVGDQGHSRIMRVYLEKVKGVYQGACFPFREGFSSGVLRMAWGHDGSMFVGMTSRGWSATGKAPYGLQKLEWTGQMPFEVKSIQARVDGFELEFTQPVDRKQAGNPASYQITGFTYQYHQTYGSDIVHRKGAPIRGVQVSEDGLRARLVVDGLREGYIHEIKAPGVASTEGLPLLHDTAYYTLNRIPEGIPLVMDDSPSGGRVDTRVLGPPSQGRLPQAKRQTEPPAEWEDGPQVTVSIGTLPGLKFDTPSFDVRAGSRVRLVFNNNDDMLHNLVIVKPGTADDVGNAAIQLGLDGQAMQYVPDSDEVLFHTNLLGPETAESIYFVAPTEPGEYVFVCTFPGHAFTMRGVMRVVR